MFDLWWFLFFFNKICVRFSTQCWCPHFHTWTWPSWIRTQSFWLILRWGGVKSHHIFWGDEHQQIPAILGEFPGFSPIATWKWISSMWKNMTCHVLVKVSAISLPREVAPVKRFRILRLMTQATAQEHHLVDRIWCGCQNWLKAWFMIKKHYIIYANMSTCGVIGKYHGFFECVSLRNQLSEWSDMMKNVWP